MRTTVIWVLLLTMAVLAGCKSDDLDLQSMPTESLQYNSSGLKFPGTSSGTVTVFLKNVRDSRCPRNVICIHQGWVELSFLVRDNSDSVRVETHFYANKEKDKLKKFKLNNSEYGLRVYQVLPFPEEGKNLKLEDYRVGVAISPI